MPNFLDAAQGVNYLAPYATRNVGGGGAASGALGGFSSAAGIAPMTGPAAPFVLAGGALAGGIAGALRKHAKSAATDISTQDARAALARAYADAYGGQKQATPEFLDQALAGGSSKWAGAKEVQNAIANIQANAAREQGLGAGSRPAVSSGQQIGYRPGSQLLDSGNKAALLRILGGA